MATETESDDGADTTPIEYDEEALQKHRDWLLLVDHTSSRDFDRVLTTLASSALAVSLLFIHDVAPHPQDVAWVVIAWVFFAASLLVILGSYLTSMMATHKSIENIDNRDEGTDPYATTKSGEATKWLNSISAGLLIVGVISLVVFAGLNVNREASPNGSTASTTTTTVAHAAGP